MGAHVATHVWLFVVVAEALASALLHLGRRKTAEGPRRGCCARDSSCCAGLRTWRKGRPWWLTSATLLLRLLQCCHGRGAALKGAGQEHRRLEVGRGAHRDVHPNVLREATDEELRLLERGDVPGVRENRLETVRELLYRGVERQPAQLSQPRAVRWVGRSKGGTAP
jgi:hypothetical protein